ncbi:MAG: hypothetical protein DMG86_14260 [Acidobacteria bacterium]|nr:MAG: hypothetical protein DMG86_14260 [Acidobacteriota bacterium]
MLSSETSKNGRSPKATLSLDRFLLCQRISMMHVREQQNVNACEGFAMALHGLIYCAENCFLSTQLVSKCPLAAGSAVSPQQKNEAMQSQGLWEQWAVPTRVFRELDN